MTPNRPQVTYVIHRDGDIESKSYKVPLWVHQGMKISGVTMAILILIGIVLYAPIVLTAAKVPALNQEIERLSAENRQVRELASTLQALEERYDQVRSMLGADVIPEPGDTNALFPAPAVYARSVGFDPEYPTGPSLPVHWPVDSLFHPGVITRGHGQPNGGGENHAGVDIAIPKGTPIRASGGGTVREAGYDPEYGWYVLMDHVSGYQTMYGHAARLLVATNQQVQAGQVIALAGSTGRSTAPHLHFEKRHAGQSIDPLAVITQES
jgi:murein DD-endopeptidase MepM/ murein hydrolase activator NlpD